MKKTLNLIIKPLLILVLIAFTGCEKDLYEESIKDSSKSITVSKISLDNLDKIISSKISTEISKFKNIRSESTSQGRFEYNSSLEIFIDTENGRLREIDGKEFYTFPMFKENETDLQNVLFEIKSDGSLQSYFIKYNVTPEEFNQLSNEEILNLDSEYQKIMSADGSTEYICVDLYSVETEYNSFDPHQGNGNPAGSSSVATFVGSFCNWVEGGGSGGNPNDSGVGGNTSGGHTGGGASSTGGSLYTGPVSLSPDLLLMKDFVRDFLDDDQRACYVQQTEQAQNNIFVYLVENDFTNISKLFIKDCLDKINQDPNDEIKSITPFLIVKRINDINLDPCGKSILNKLRNLSQTNLGSIIERFGGTNSSYILNISSGLTINPNVFGTTNWVINSSGIVVHNNYNITVRPEITQNSTDIAIAGTILHEFIHAYFLSLIDDCYLANNCSLLQSFPEIWNFYVINNPTGTLTDLNTQHAEIANLYVNIIGAALQEMFTNTPVTAGMPINQIYTDLAWCGLEGTTPYINLPQSDKDRILNRQITEYVNQSTVFAGQTVVPHGLRQGPCN